MIEVKLTQSRLQFRGLLIKQGYDKPEVARLLKQYIEWTESDLWFRPEWSACCDGWEAIVTNNGKVKWRKAV